MQVTVESITVDMLKLREEQRKRRESIKSLLQGIEGLCKEQAELRQFASGEKEHGFDQESLKNCIDRIDSHIVSIEATIQKEQAGIDQLDKVLTFLEKRKCQLEVTSQLTGISPPES